MTIVKETRMDLPSCFCWSRFGTEAGQRIEDIIERKEEERIANGGVFLWGIGNALGPSMKELVRRTKKPEALFSPIKSTAKVNDAEPTALAMWMIGETLEGAPYILPTYSLVTSRYDPSSPKQTHYALVCWSQEPLSVSRLLGTLNAGALCNLLTARRVGASQVTAVVQRHVTNQVPGRQYDIAMRVSLTYPYFVALKSPVLLLKTDSAGWSAQVRQVWVERQRSNHAEINDRLLVATR